MPRVKKSIVWDHFIKVLDEGNVQCVQCTLCQRTMKFFGNTTNLKEHLRRSHRDKLAAHELQNDGYILFVDGPDGPKVKRMKKIKQDETDENESADITTEEIIQDNFSIKENLYETIAINRSEQASTEPVFKLGVDDFSKVAETTLYVDKSLLIEDLLRYPFVLITAPHGFGKSTNWNMVKRFLQIEVNDEGIPKDIRQTDNYKLFRDKRLAITERQKLCKEHMGQHPVISINFKPLSFVENYDDMLSKFRLVLRRSFIEHRYLLKNMGLLLQSSNELFLKYCDPALNLTLTVPEIEMGFVFLSELLFLHFRKQSTILIDNYDAYVDSLIFKNNPDADRIINFIQLVIKELLKSNPFVDRVYLTGVFPVACTGISTVSMNLKQFFFLDNHCFCKYYGFTSEELSEVLKRTISDTAERDKTDRIISEYYGGYLVPTQSLNIYNIWSVLNYLENKRIPLNYWCKSEHYDLFKEIFSIQEISEEIQLLLLGMSRCTDISKSVTAMNINTLSTILTDKVAASCENTFLKILFHLGYVTANESLTLDQSEMFLKIPNSEIRLEFARILKDTFVKRYTFKDRFIRTLHSATNAFNVQSFDHSKFENFCKSLNDLFTNSTYYTHPNDSNDFQNILFSFMASKYCITQSEIFKNHLSSSVDLLTVNDSGVGIFIETKIFNSQRSETYQEVAVSAHRQIIDKKCCDNFDRNFEATMGKILLGICVDRANAISIAYSYHFQIGDDIENPIFLSTTL